MYILQHIDGLLNLLNVTLVMLIMVFLWCVVILVYCYNKCCNRNENQSHARQETVISPGDFVTDPTTITINPLFDNVGGVAFSRTSDHDEAVIPLIRDHDYFKQYTILLMNGFHQQFCYLRCLIGPDLHTFVDKMVDMLITKNTDLDRIEEILKTGVIPLVIWQLIMSNIAPNLFRTYNLCILCTEFGYPLPPYLFEMARYAPFKHVVIVNSFVGGKVQPNQRPEWIIVSPGHIERVLSFTAIPVEPMVSIDKYVYWQDQSCVV